MEMATILLTLSFLGGVIFWQLLKSRNMHIWMPDYLIKKFSTAKNNNKGPKHIYVCLADHYEPYLGNVNKEKAHQRVTKWIKNYPLVASSHSDSSGRAPIHSHFYPEEEYDEWVFEQLEKLCQDGLADIDIHLHHDNDNEENLRTTLNRFKKMLHEKHGMLRKNENGEIVYGFIHGNWALANSRPDGKWCGVDNEIEILLETGCEFDMTMPSAPSDTQTSTVNSIYLVKQKKQSKSHDKGELLQVGDTIHDDQLLMIQGPLNLDWGNRKWGILPRIEAGEISFDAPPRKSRVKLWEDCAICVKGAEDHLFIKLHTHGLNDQNLQMFFDLNGLDNLWSYFEERYKNKPDYQLHYVSAWEMNQKIRSLANGVKF